MCYEIGSEVILYNLFKKKDECSFTDLVSLKDKIEFQLPTVYVDVTRNSVFTTIETNPNMFYWENNKIHRKSEFNNLVSDYNIDHRIKMDGSLKNKFLSLLEEIE